MDKSFISQANEMNPIGRAAFEVGSEEVMKFCQSNDQQGNYSGNNAGIFKKYIFVILKLQKM